MLFLFFAKANKCFVFCPFVLFKPLTYQTKIIYNFFIKIYYILTIKSARGTDPTKAQQPFVNTNEKGANFRKKDLRDGIAKKTFSLSCLQAGFFYYNGGKIYYG